jgi:hypothetical protein
MANATVAAPSLDSQIGAFKGLSTEDGVVMGAQEGFAGPEPEEPLDGTTTPTEEAPPAKPKPKSTQERIDQAVRRQREAERRADEATGRYKSLEERLARIESGQRPLTAQEQTVNGRDPNAPDPAKYQYGELDSRYVADLARHETRKVIEAENEKRDRATQSAKDAQEAQRRTEFVKAAVAKLPDFVEVVMETAARGEWPLSKTIGELALESPDGHEILYALASDPVEAHRVAALSATRQAAWFGAQEARLSAGSSAATGARSPAMTTRAPPPPARRVVGNGGSNPQVVSPDTQDFAAFEALAKQAGRR